MEAAATTLPGRGAKLGRTGWRVLRSDAALVERFRAGDEQAFAALYRRHQSRIYAVCLGVLGSPEDAKDAMQEVWAAATTGLRASAPDNVPAWLARVARNSSIDIVRGRRETPHPTPHDLRPGPTRSAEPSAGARADLNELVGALGQLPERQRSALLMRELGGYSYVEIGRTLHLTERSVSGLIARARISLREARRGSLTCGAVRDHLAAELDGRRRPAEVRRHLRSCDGCREFRGALRDDRRALRSLAPPGAAKLLAVLLAGRGGRAAVLAAAIGKGSAGGEAVKLAAFCAAAVCATAGVENIDHAANHDRPSAGVAGSQQRPATSGPRRAAVAATPARSGSALVATRPIASSAAATAPAADAPGAGAAPGSSDPTGADGGDYAWNPSGEGAGPPAQAAGYERPSSDDRDPQPAGSGGRDRSPPEGGSGRDGGAVAERSAGWPRSGSGSDAGGRDGGGSDPAAGTAGAATAGAATSGAATSGAATSGAATSGAATSPTAPAGTAGAPTQRP